VNRVLALLAVAISGSAVGSAWAEDPVLTCLNHPKLPACVAGAGDGFGAAGSTSSSSGGTSSGGRGAAAPDSPRTEVIYDFAPACTSNSRLDRDLICGAALNICLPSDKGIVNYWRWEQVVYVASGKPVGRGEWVRSLGEFCLGPAKVGVPSVAAIAGVISRDFKNLVVRKGVAVVRPGGTTLVNYATEFSTTAGTYVLAPLTILGRRVVITAIPQRYDWYFGDGAATADGTAGPLLHSYPKSGTVGPYVVITWTGTFTVDGGPQREVFGTALTTGDATPLTVKEARAELVTR
jgi:hypothetical protein